MSKELLNYNSADKIRSVRLVNKTHSGSFMEMLESVVQEIILKNDLPPFNLRDAEGNYKPTYEVLKYLSSHYDPKKYVSCEYAEQIATALLKESYIVPATEIQEAFKKLNNE